MINSMAVCDKFSQVTVEKKYMLSKEWLHCKEECDEDKYQCML